MDTLFKQVVDVLDDLDPVRHQAIPSVFFRNAHVSGLLIFWAANRVWLISRLRTEVQASEDHSKKLLQKLSNKESHPFQASLFFLVIFVG